MGQLIHHSGWIQMVAVSTENTFIYIRVCASRRKTWQSKPPSPQQTARSYRK